MKHLLGSVAIAVLIVAGAPAWAQSSNASQSKQAPQAQTQSGMSSTGSGATTPSDATGNAGQYGGTAAAGTGSKSQHRGMSRKDNMAEELNREELRRAMQNSRATTGSGETQMQTPAGGQTGGASGGSR